MKRRSNQLVAAPDTTPTSSSDGYYKRRKNQLVRTITENHVKQGAAVVDDGLNSERQVAEKAITKKQTVLPNVHNHSKFSLVWTLNGMKSSREDGSSFNHKVRPYMFPWKRATNLRSFVQSLGSIPNDHSISTIRQKLLFSRKRDTVYTRSAYGLSLRRSKVLSVCGASLKWSKSIERNSRKANQEATLAVAAAEKRKRGQNSIAPSNSNRRNNVSRKCYSVMLLPGRRVLNPAVACAFIYNDQKHLFRYLKILVYALPYLLSFPVPYLMSII
nr:uncharacterized protein LOC109170148 isoform X1 [Ipomoea batatas]